MGIFGWSFINCVNMKRHNPFIDGNGGYKSTLMFLFICWPLIYLMTGIVIFRQKYDLSGYCNEDQIDSLDNQEA